MDRFYSATIGEVGSRVELTPEATHHMVTVRRVRPGGEVELFDGAGTEAVARLVSVDKRLAVVEVLSLTRGGATGPADADVRCRLTIATALPKGARAAALVRACTEIGVWRVQPMIAERSVVRPAPGEVIGRLVRSAREAAGQSRRAWVPEVMPVVTFADVMEGMRRASDPPEGDTGRYDLGILADADAGSRSIRDVLSGNAGCRSVLAVVGPEGGFTDAERDLARRSGCTPVRIDGPVMRVETACAVVTALVLFACS